MSLVLNEQEQSDLEATMESAELAVESEKESPTDNGSAIVLQQLEQPAETHLAVEPTMRVMSPAQLAQTMQLYRQMQAEIDKAMPDAIMSIGYGEKVQKFRKKAYWRAVEMAFALRVECMSEKRVEFGDDWGYEVVYRATKPNGSYVDGDGMAMASEKTAYVWEFDPKTRKRTKTDVVDEAKTRQNATVHNVRSHAHTRAFNRAVSNCVGFGEVSAEEINHG